MPLDDWETHPWKEVFAATLCPFHDDERIDDEGLREYLAELAAVAGIKGLTCNGHTGEIMSLGPNERTRVTRIAAEVAAVSDREVRIISGVPLKAASKRSSMPRRLKRPVPTPSC